MIDTRALLNSLPVLVLICHATWAEDAAGAQPAADTGGHAETALLEQGFRQPADADKPWAYWWWVNGNVTKQSIRRDLEQMKAKGIGGLLMFDSRGYHDDILPPPPSPMEFMSPPWRRLLKFAISEADRLGLQMSVNLSSGAGALKGPWDVGDGAPKKLIWTSLAVRGPGRARCRLQPADSPHFRDVAVVAARHAAPAEAKDSPGQPPAEEVVFDLSGPWRPVQTRLESRPIAVEVVDLAGRVDARGRLAWDVPEGRWTLIRFASAIMEGHENDVDILDKGAVETYFDRLGKAILHEAGAAAGRTLSHFYSVSWEGAAPTWTPAFEGEFEKYRGYKMRPFLPVLAGMTVTNREVSRRFLRDYHKTLGDCFMNNCYGTLRDLCHRAGLRWHSESGGPWNRKLPSFKHADQLAFLGRNDMPQGEFWHLGHAMNRPAAMAAHIYGRRLAATEAFTHMRPHWSAYPAVLKPEADAAFCDGSNQFIWHTFTASPCRFGKPGIEYFAGTHLNPNVTWWEQSGGLLRYLARCQFMLRQGRFVGDVCCYTGDQPYLHWGRGAQWSAHPTLSLGQGYSYDLINTEVLLHRVSVEDGDLVLPDAMRYRLLVLDLEEETALARVLRKVVALARAGATIVLGSRRPRRAPGLRNYPAADAEVGRLADQLWGPPGEPPRPRPLGVGKVIAGVGLDETLAAEGIAADFVGPWHYIHRRAPGTDIYFLAGEGSAQCTFRTRGKEPELWDPKTGRIRDAVPYRASDDGRTIVPIELPRNGSVFVVFRRPAWPWHLASVTGPAGGMELLERIEGGVRARLWRQGVYVLATSDGRQETIQAEAMPRPQTLTGPWQVGFAPGWGAPESIVFDHLIPWNEHPNDGIKFFSGTATYRHTFEVDQKQVGKPARLQLGEVQQIAQVRLNGRSLGVVWTDPWSVDVTTAVKAGTNALEIDVTNLWVNRLIGDADLPPDKRLTGTNALGRDETAKFPHLRGYSSKDPLKRSGLIGPVRLEFGRQRELRFPRG